MRTALLTISLALVGVSTAFPTLGSTTRAENTGCPFAAAQAKRQLGFDPVQQKFDVSGVHAFQPPGPNDQRGPCPGLNVLANHGYINRNGITNLLEMTLASQKLGFGPDLAAAAAAIGVITGGDPITQVMSIGGPPPGLVLPPLLSRPPGLGGTHNKMEGDASPTREDAYVNNGDASSLSRKHFEHLCGLVPEGEPTGFTASVVGNHRVWSQGQSISTNPRYLSASVGGLFGLLTHFLIPGVYANHSAEHPEGILNHETLKSFYSVSGTCTNLTYQRGQERIPDNWYRSPLPGYTSANLVADFLSSAAEHPEIASLGGNTGTVNSFTGLDLGNLTGGVYNSANLLQGNNFVCFAFQAVKAAIPGRFGGVETLIAAAMNLFTSKVGPMLASLSCPELSQYNTAAFGPYPGASGAV